MNHINFIRRFFHTRESITLSELNVNTLALFFFSLQLSFSRLQLNSLRGAHMQSDSEYKVPVTGEPRTLILQLGQKVTDRIGHKVTTDDPEYWGLAGVVTDEMAEIALKMKVRHPVTIEHIIKLTGKEKAYLEDQLMKMSVVGLIEYNWENPKHEKQYVLPMFVPGSAEFTNMNEKQLEEHPEVGHFFERMSRLPLEKVTPMVPPGGAGIGMHVIPVEKAIEAENQSADVEHISHWLKKYEGKYAAGPCSCRLSRRSMGEGCGDDPRDWCIGVGDMADYLVETGKGHYITYDQVMDTLKQAEDNGLVHQITNIDGENKIFAICNCNVNVCYALRTSLLFNTPNMSRSAYVAKVNSEDCVACGRCVENCPAGAVKLGQKLCTKDGPVTYPQHELPDAVKWGPDKWDENYRDNNRINCYDTGTSPCKTACPAHIAIQGYLKKAAQGKYTEALELIKRENPFPAVCGRVCNRRCEQACTRGTIDKPVAIDEVKKFIAEQDLNAKTRFVPKIVIPSRRPGEFTDVKIAVIGAGPAGLSCAYYLAEKGYKPTVFEKNAVPGGMLVYGIPSFKLEKNIIKAEIDIMREIGVDIRCGVEAGKDITIAQLREQGYKAFYIAIGCQGGRKAGVPGEDADGVMTGVDFLREVGGNENYRLPGKTVVVGGGNVAIDVARCAVRCGSSEISMCCLDTRDIMPASPEEIAEAEAEDIKISCGWGPKEVVVRNGKVAGITFKKCVSVKDPDGRFNPKYDEDDTMTIECDHVLLSIGQSIVWGNLLDGTKVELGRGKGAVADKVTYQTAEKDIFTGGDVYTGPKFVIDAIAAGKEGALSIHKFVHEGNSLVIGRNLRQFIELDKDNIDVPQYDNTARQIPGIDTSIDQKKSFRDVRKPFTEEQVRRETSRCLGCGASVVDQNRCVGCGVCTTKCGHPEASRMTKSEDKMKAILPYMLRRAVKITFSGKKNK